MNPLKYLSLLVVVLMTISCEEQIAEIGIIEEGEIEMIGTFIVNSKSEEQSTFEIDCLEEEKLHYYKIFVDEETIQQGTIQCKSQRLDIGPIDFSEELDSDKIVLMTISEGERRFFRIIKDTTPPSLVPIVSDMNTPLKRFSWPLRCLNGDSCQYRYLINSSNNAGNVLADLSYQTLDDSVSISSGDQIYYIHAQAQDPNENESEIITVAVLIDAVPPVISAIIPPGNGIYIVGEALEWTIRYDSTLVIENNTEAPFPAISLSIGGQSRKAHYVRKNGDSELIFQYIVRATDPNTENGIQVGEAIDLYGQTIRDLAGNDADLSFASLMPDLQKVEIYHPPPALEITSDLPAINLDNKDNYQFSGTCSDLGGNIELSYNSIPLTTVLCEGGTWSSGVLAFPELTQSRSIQLSAVYTDKIGQQMTKDKSINQDTIAPTISGIIPPTAQYYTSGTIEFAMTFNEPIEVDTSDGTPSLFIVLDNGTKPMPYLRKNSAYELVFQYTIEPPDDSSRNSMSIARRIELNSSRIQDIVGNSATLQFSDSIPLSFQGVKIDTIPPQLSITNPSTINLSNRDGYEFSGACSENSRDVSLEYRINSGTVNPLRSVQCNQGQWNSEQIHFSNNVQEQMVELVATHLDGAGHSTTVSKRATLDTIAPSISAIHPPADNDYQSGNIEFTLTFDEPIEIDITSGIPTLPLILKNRVASAPYVRSVGNNQLVFQYTIAEMDYTGKEGLRLGEHLLLNSSSIQDLHNNPTSLVISHSLHPDLQGVKVNALLEVAITDSPSYVNLLNKDHFELSGTCNRNGYPVELSHLSDDITKVLSSTICTLGRWSIGPLIIPTGFKKRSVQLIARHSRDIDDGATAMKDITEDIIPPGLNITSAPALSSDTITNNYIFSGVCDEYETKIKLKYLIEEAETTLPDATCSSGVWSSSAILFPSGAISNTVKVVASQKDLLDNRTEVTVDISQGSQESLLSFDRDLVINTENRISFQPSGTCQIDGTVSIEIPGHTTVTTECSNGTWESDPINVYKLPIGKIPIKAKMQDAPNDVTMLVDNVSDLYFSHLFSAKFTYTQALIEGHDNNYLGTFSIPKAISSSNLHFEINSLDIEGIPENDYTEEDINNMRETWKHFFSLDASTGMLTLENDRSIVSRFFDFTDLKIREINHLSRMIISNQKEGLPFPETFSLNIGIKEEKDQVVYQSTTLNVKVHRPAFGQENCDMLNWDDDLGTGEDAWTEEEVARIRSKQCKETYYSVRPRGIEFPTTQADIDLLPDGLSQDKDNYEVIFKDEFTEPLDHRRWIIRRGNPCNRIRTEDGKLHLTLYKDCVSSRGIMVPIAIIPRLKFKYGYIEIHFSSIPVGKKGAMVGVNSYGNVGGAFGPPTDEIPRNKTLYKFICRGDDRAKKRARWLHTMGMEMQLIEMFKNTRTKANAWWVFHSMHVGAGERCHDYSGVPRIYSGLLWDTMTWKPNKRSYTVGLEWTPSGYRGYINGVPYNQKETQYGEYGYALSDVTPVYGYQYFSIPESNLMPRSVSHTFQEFKMTLSTHPNVDGDPSRLPDDWESSLVVDYFRVYQPKDDYTTETKVYD